MAAFSKLARQFARFNADSHGLFPFLPCMGYFLLSGRVKVEKRESKAEPPACAAETAAAGGAGQQASSWPLAPDFQDTVQCGGRNA